MIAPIGAVSAAGVAGVAPVAVTGAAQTESVQGAGFAQTLATSLESVSSLQASADTLAVRAATGDLEDVHQYTIAATEAKVATETTVAFRNKAVEAFNDIMRMQV